MHTKPVVNFACIKELPTLMKQLHIIPRHLITMSFMYFCQNFRPYSPNVLRQKQNVGVRNKIGLYTNLIPQSLFRTRLITNRSYKIMNKIQALTNMNISMSDIDDQNMSIVSSHYLNCSNNIVL